MYRSFIPGTSKRPAAAPAPKCANPACAAARPAGTFWLPVRGDAGREAAHGARPAALVCSVACFKAYCRAHPGAGGPRGERALDP